jgi:hypothetical protein
MATTTDRSSTPTPTPSFVPQAPSHATDQPPSPTQSTNPTQAIHAPLPTRRMLSQLLRQWQQSLSAQAQPISPAKDNPGVPFNLSTTVSEFQKPEIQTPQTPTQPSRTPSRLVVSPQYTSPISTSASPHLQLTTPTHTRRASITTFLPAESLLMSPIPRTRNPGGFRPTSSGSISLRGDLDEGISSFGEMVGLVGGWEEKMRSATAWAVVNTTNPTVEEVETVLEEERKCQSVDVTG